MLQSRTGLQGIVRHFYGSNARAQRLQRPPQNRLGKRGFLPQRRHFHEKRSEKDEIISAGCVAALVVGGISMASGNAVAEAEATTPRNGPKATNTIHMDSRRVTGNTCMATSSNSPRVGSVGTSNVSEHSPSPAPNKDSTTTSTSTEESSSQKELPFDISLFENDEPEYSLLPEEDEPTFCIICNINRQGPCRQQWRWFEKCMKMSTADDNDDDDDDESTSERLSICTKPSMIWMKCMDGNEPLYVHYSNVQFEDQLMEIEASVDSENWVPYFPKGMKPALDLSGLYGFLDGIMGPMDYSKYAEDDRDSFQFIPARAKIELFDTKRNLPIELAYVRDTDTGILLGFYFFTEEKKAQEPSGEMSFYLRPTTKCISIYALYRKPPSESSDNDNELDTANNNKAGGDTEVPSKKEGDDGVEEDAAAPNEEVMYYRTVDLAMQRLRDLKE